jgi:UDP-N-acetylmuramoyl-tripeptide--D-alanyl-D-alanine ligase
MMKLSEASDLLKATFKGEDRGFQSVSTDTRSLVPGALFVALRGERFDGHDFLQEAARAGAVAALVESSVGVELADSGLALLIVPDTKLALGELARRWRQRFAIPLIAVCGSNGKTTVKEMIACILRVHFGETPTLATVGNLNNDIGLPLTLLRLRPEHRVAVVELGMNHPGETARLAAIAGPTVGVVNNAQREHQEFMKSVEDVAREHGALFEALPANGTAVINGDDAYSEYWRRVATASRLITFAVEHSATVQARYHSSGFGFEVELLRDSQSIKFILDAAGVHNVRNAAAAAAAALAAGVNLSDVAVGLAKFRPVKGRLQRKTGRGGLVLLDDTYNANPDSVMAAIDVLADLPPPRILVLGDMGEVGERGGAFHADVGAYAKARRIEQMLCLGELTRHAVSAFGSGAEHFSDCDALLRRVAESVVQRPAILVKGSRFMRMERVVDYLVVA